MYLIQQELIQKFYASVNNLSKKIQLKNNNTLKKMNQVSISTI